LPQTSPSGARLSSRPSAAANEVTMGEAPMVVIFGRPGAGKTTIANAVARSLGDGGDAGSGSKTYLQLDLDVCVPQWMRDNFAKGIYPTLQQRAEFIQSACNYVQGEIDSAMKQHSKQQQLVTIVSFSFVNIDLRTAFREEFPQAQWILVDTHKSLAEERIASREGHFYKTTSSSSSEDRSANDATKEAEGDKSDDDNSEWEFRPVAFPHMVLDGRDPVDANAKRIAELIESKT
ncbi:hypothetical protein ACHAXT_001767, partial [Thalassiosira profunda]